MHSSIEVWNWQWQKVQFKKDETESEDDVPYGYGFFHFVFATGAMYFAMLLIGWNTNHTMKKYFPLPCLVYLAFILFVSMSKMTSFLCLGFSSLNKSLPCTGGQLMWGGLALGSELWMSGSLSVCIVSTSVKEKERRSVVVLLERNILKFELI